MMSIWDLFQHQQISHNIKRSTDAQLDAKSALAQINELEEKVDSLSLLCHALFEELQKTTGISEEQLKEKMIEIDLRDGKLDGKYDPNAGTKCSECGHEIKKKRPNCFWCGAKLG